MNPSSHDFDLFVIGGGSGGVRAARMAATRGVRVGMAESGRMGGTCVNVGCIPKKLYSYGAHYAEGFTEAAGYGWEIAQPPTLNWATLKANRAKEITRLNGIYEGLMTNAQVLRLQGHGRLLDAHTVEVTSDDGKTTRHSARHILIATGGTPFVPEFPGCDLVVTAGPIRKKIVPTIQPGWLKPGAFASSVDFGSCWSLESLRQVDRLATDDLPQFEVYRGLGYFEGFPRPYAGLGELITGQQPGRASDQERTLAINLGLALEDLAVAPEVYRHAKARGLGTRLAL